MRTFILFIVVMHLFLISACDQKNPSKTSNNESNTKIHVKKDSKSQTVDYEDPAASLHKGSYTLNIENGKINLYAKEANRLDILLDLADKTSIELIYNDVPDTDVTIEAQQTSIYEVIALLLHNTLYTVSYSAQPNELGFRINNIFIGETDRDDSYPVGELFSNQDEFGEPRLSIVLPQPEDELYLGGSETDLENRLQYGTNEERAYAVSELRMDPAGFNAAYKIFMHDESSEVKLAVLELIESEEYLLAKQMVAMALNDKNTETVLYALGIIESNGDFSMTQQIKKLYSHPTKEIRDYARSVNESLKAPYFEPDEYIITPEEKALKQNIN